jgi:RHS repeat-associated protein
VRQLVDSDDQVDLAQSYDPFGVPFETFGPGESDFAYTGVWYGSYIDLVFLRARYYDPAGGRFLAKDPWPGSPEQPLTLNRWSYVQGNPINFIDPSGLYPIQGCQEDDCTVHEVVSFIINRMREDAASKEINNVRTLNETHYYEDAWDAFEKMPWWQRLLVTYFPPPVDQGLRGQWR